ncbi:MAG: prepilin-type N-terminal cleavage/methylation domain-containing protein [Planctomycetota bacterium]|jgi:prepilin-type N-terminal cleavage/methylation domain-containing protein
MRSKPANNNAAQTRGISRMLPGFSLAEMLAAMTIGAMVLVAVLSIYNRAERSAAAVTRRLDYSRTPREILQRIAEDLDRVISSGTDATITIQNKYDKLFPTARLVISRTFQDRANRNQKFEEITWQASYDFESLGEGLVLYRSHSGIAAEDKIIDKNKEDWEKELFVPLCGGVTFFRIRAFKGEELVDKWSGTLPPGIEMAISFAEPYKKVDGTLDVPDEEKIIRTIAVDRSRKIKFQVAEGMYTGDVQEDIPVDETPVDEDKPAQTPEKTEKVKR